jgi:hypothetical protein
MLPENGIFQGTRSPGGQKKSSGKGRFHVGLCRIEKCLCYMNFIAPCCSLLLFRALYYYLFFVLCILNKKKKNLYKYICVYKKGKFVFYASLLHHQAASRRLAVMGIMPGASAEARMRLVSCFTFEKMSALAPGRSGDRVFWYQCPPV